MTGAAASDARAMIRKWTGCRASGGSSHRGGLATDNEILKKQIEDIKKNKGLLYLYIFLSENLDILSSDQIFKLKNALNEKDLLVKRQIVESLIVPGDKALTFPNNLLFEKNIEIMYVSEYRIFVTLDCRI